MAALCIFDLDGTLWNVNSHTDILNKHFKTYFFESKISKVFARLCPHIFQYLIDRLFERFITEYDIKNYNPEFRQSAIKILRKELEKGNKVIIVSNAPIDIMMQAGRRLGVSCYRFPIGMKQKIFEKEKKDSFSEIKVITDNISDIPLLKFADQYVIYVTPKTKRVFLKNGFDEKCLRDRDEK